MVKLDHQKVVKQISENKPQGRRRTETPRLRRLEDVEKDLREMKVK
jgi:hypothetical protein